jgi:CRP-like cAMP-binding protein
MLYGALRNERRAVDFMMVQNRLLAGMAPEVLAQIAPILQRVALKQREILQEPNRPIEHVYFIERGVASVFARTRRDGLTEAAIIGRLGLIGVPAVLGTVRSPHRCLMQVEGEALRIRTEQLHDAMMGSPALRQQLFNFVHVMMVQNAQNALCNARHDLASRLPRWLLLADDLVDGNEIPVTHVLLSMMLGVRRAGITTTLADLQRAGALHKSRGAITIIDRSVLESSACECYQIIADEYARLIAPRSA